MARSPLVRALDDDGVVLPLLVGPGAVGAMLLGSAAPEGPWWAPPILLVGCAGAARGCSHRGTAAVLGLLWGLFTDGFVLHRLGRLTPSGPGDLLWWGTFLGVALLATARPPRRPGRSPTTSASGTGRGRGAAGTGVIEEIGNGAGGIVRSGRPTPALPTPAPPPPTGRPVRLVVPTLPACRRN